MIGDGAPDFTALLRRQQTVEYRKLCRELRLPENSAVLKALAPPVRKANFGAGRGSVEVDLPGLDPGTHAYDFTGCYLGDRQIHPLAAALAVDRQLTAVRLPGVGLADAGMVALCEQLKRSTQIFLLDVSGNRFSWRGAEACLALARGAPRLRELVLGDTVLDAAFCERRGLDSKYATCRHALFGLVAPRLAEAAAATAKEAAAAAERRRQAESKAAAAAERPRAEPMEAPAMEGIYDADEAEARRILGVGQSTPPQEASPQPPALQGDASEPASPPEVPQSTSLDEG